VFKKFAKGLYLTKHFIEILSSLFSFRANIYPCPENPVERQELTMGVMTRLEDLNVVLRQTQDHRQRLLFETSRTLRTWQIKVRKIKSVYHTMNMFNNDIARKCFIAECWTPNSQLNTLQSALEKGSVSLAFLFFFI
jgi:V-type H+-transporting ATPase subunit a